MLEKLGYIKTKLISFTAYEDFWYIAPDLEWFVLASSYTSTKYRTRSLTKRYGMYFPRGEYWVADSLQQLADSGPRDSFVTNENHPISASTNSWIVDYSLGSINV